MTSVERLLRNTLYKKSLYDFVKDFWKIVDPAPFVDGKIIQFYCEVFQYFCRDWIGYDEIDIKVPALTEDIDIIDVRNNHHNLNINVPPRHMKSMIFNVFGPVWLWLRAPVKAASVSHNTALAGTMNNKRVKILESDLFKEIFKDEVWLDINARGKLVDRRGGELYSIARDSFTGFGADIIINDDLTNAETARRDQAEMLAARSYYQNTMPSRINDRNKYIILNIQQRLAPNDITGHILAEPKLAAEYSFVVIPAKFKKHTFLVCPISGDIFEFQKGDTLWPERFADYEGLKNEVGESVWETQYLQNPIASDKTVIKESMINRIDKVDAPSIEVADMIYASHDFPVKDKDSSDFLGSSLAYRVGSNLYFMDCLEKKMAFVKSVEYVKNLEEFYPGIIQVIEDKANGSPILQQLQDVVAGLQAYSPGTASKMQRLESATMYIQNIYFVKSKFDKLTQTWQMSPSLDNLIQRLLNFPFVEHDDIVDSFSQLVLFVYMDRRYMVYGRAFNDSNIVVFDDAIKSSEQTIFFNKEGDIWKVCRIGIKYSTQSTLYIIEEARFKASVEDGLDKMKEFAKGKKVFIDCSATPALQGMYAKKQYIERYELDDFDKSVVRLNLAFSKKQVLLNKDCNLTKADIENFKFSKSKTENVKYATQKDGFVACIRVAMKYFGV